MASDFVTRGQALVAGGQLQEAVRVCRLGLLAQPTAVEGRLVLGSALLLLRRYDEVLAEMRVALELDGTSARALALKGEALLRKGDAFQAAEALGRARALDPESDAVRGLLEEAERAASAAGGRGKKGKPGSSLSRSGIEAGGYGDLGDSLTKHYPAHRGLDPGGTTSGNVTRPAMAAPAPAPGPARGGRAAAARAQPLRGQEPRAGVARRASPSPAELAIGDRSGTVEVDPDLEGVEVYEEGDDPVADPPFATEDIDEGDIEDVEDVEDDLEALEDVDDLDDVDGIVEVSSSDLLEGSNATALRKPLSDSDEDTEFYQGRLGDAPPGTRGQVGRGDFDEVATVGARPPIAAPTMSAATRRSASVPSLDVREPDRRTSGARGAARPLDAAQQRSAAALDRLFPEDESGVSSIEPVRPAAGGGGSREAKPTGPAAKVAAAAQPRKGGGDTGGLGRGQTDDMRMIRAGLGLEPDQGPGPVAEEPSATGSPATAGAGTAAGLDRFDSTGVVVGQGPPPGALPGEADARGKKKGIQRSRHDHSSTMRVASEPIVARRPVSRLAVIAYSAAAAIVIGGGVFAGYEIREVLLDRDIAPVRREAAAAARDDTWGGYTRARDAYARIAAARGNAADRAALVRADATLAADFGEQVEVDAAALAATQPDAAVARVYMALAADDVPAAEAAVAALPQAAPAEPMAAYLAGRVALLAERWDAAAESFRAALRVEQRPSVFVGLGLVEAGRGQLAEAKAAFDRALDLVPGHPAALIGRARAIARGGALSNDGQPEKDLEALIAEAALPFDDQPRGVSPAQVAWAAIALAEVGMARSDAASVRAALARAQASGLAERDRAFSEALTADLLAAGDTAAARAAAEQAVNRWPARLQPRIVLAEVALRLEHPEDALKALSAAGELAGSADALAARGRAQLALGELELAATDLDAALALSAELASALVARAELDLLRGKPTAAVERLAKRYAAGGDAELGMVYARALRGDGQRAQARTVLERLIGMGAAAGPAWLELAELARDESDLPAARKAFEKALTLLPEGSPGRIDARLGVALLLLDTGDALGARETLDQLAVEAPDNGRALIESARVSTITGALDAAQTRLDKAEGQPSVARWLLARERGRVALKKRQIAVAITELERAVSLRTNDGETRLLLIDAHLAVEDGNSARKALEAVLRDFANRPDVKQLAIGRIELYFARNEGALTAFAKARTQLEQDKAPPRAIADAMTWLGRAHYYSDQLEKAKTLLQAAVELDPSQADAWVYLGYIDNEKNNARSALAAFQKATKLDEANADAWFFLGETALQQKQRKLAKQALEKYLTLSPEGEQANEARGMLRGL